jgi:hypothetical protein
MRVAGMPKDARRTRAHHTHPLLRGVPVTVLRGSDLELDDCP